MSHTQSEVVKDSDVIPQSRARALLGPLVGIGAGTLVIAFSQSIEVPEVGSQFSPRWWPEACGVVVILFSLAAAIKDGVRPRGANEDVEAGTPAGVLRVILVFAAVGVYGLAWSFFDFRLVTLLLLVALVAIGGGRGWKSMMIFPVVVTVILWVLFGLLLRVPV